MSEQSFDALRDSAEDESPRVQLKTESGTVEVIMDHSGAMLYDPKNKSCCVALCRHIRHGAQDLFAACVVFWKTLANFESFVAVCSAVVATCFFNFHDFGEQYFAAKLSWTFVSLAVVFPLTYEINQAFRRREDALELFASVKACCVAIFMAHLHWNWGDNGRAKLPETHSKTVEDDIHNFMSTLCTYLCLPTVTRARNTFTIEGKTERDEQIPLQRQLFTRLYSILRRLSFAVEVLKENGLPPNEASRINQYHSFLVRDMEKLHNIKEYRTPQGTRSFARVFIQLMPWFYGPYFVWVTHSQDDAETGFTFALVLAVFTSMAMVGLYNVQRALQDPFDEDGLDDIKVSVMCREVRHAMAIVKHKGPDPVQFLEDDDMLLIGHDKRPRRFSMDMCVP